MLGWAFKAILGKVRGWALTNAWAITTADPVCDWAGRSWLCSFMSAQKILMYGALN